MIAEKTLQEERTKKKSTFTIIATIIVDRAHLPDNKFLFGNVGSTVTRAKNAFTMAKACVGAIAPTNKAGMLSVHNLWMSISGRSSKS